MPNSKAKPMQEGTGDAVSAGVKYPPEPKSKPEVKGKGKGTPETEEAPEQ